MNRARNVEPLSQQHGWVVHKSIDNGEGKKSERVLSSKKFSPEVPTLPDRPASHKKSNFEIQAPGRTYALAAVKARPPSYPEHGVGLGAGPCSHAVLAAAVTTARTRSLPLHRTHSLTSKSNVRRNKVAQSNLAPVA